MDLKPKKVKGKIIAVFMDDVFARMERDAQSLNKGSFCSRAYDSARRRMTRCGATQEHTDKFARAQWSQALKMWNEMD